MIDRGLVFATLSVVWPTFWLIVFLRNWDIRFVRWIRNRIGVSKRPEGKEDTK